jgi:hypothetical protein
MEMVRLNQDMRMWGIAKSQYMFADLAVLKMQGTLKDPGGSQKKKMEKENTKGHGKKRKEKSKKDNSDHEEEGSPKKGKSSGSKSHK